MSLPEIEVFDYLSAFFTAGGPSSTASDASEALLVDTESSNIPGTSAIGGSPGLSLIPTPVASIALFENATPIDRQAALRNNGADGRTATLDTDGEIAAGTMVNIPDYATTTTTTTTAGGPYGHLAFAMPTTLHPGAADDRAHTTDVAVDLQKASAASSTTTAGGPAGDPQQARFQASLNRVKEAVAGCHALGATTTPGGTGPANTAPIDREMLSPVVDKMLLPDPAATVPGTQVWNILYFNHDGTACKGKTHDCPHACSGAGAAVSKAVHHYMGLLEGKDILIAAEIGLRVIAWIETQGFECVVSGGSKTPREYAIFINTKTCEKYFVREENSRWGTLLVTKVVNGVRHTLNVTGVHLYNKRGGIYAAEWVDTPNMTVAADPQPLKFDDVINVCDGSVVFGDFNAALGEVTAASWFPRVLRWGPFASLPLDAPTTGRRQVDHAFALLHPGLVGSVKEVTDHDFAYREDGLRCFTHPFLSLRISFKH